MKSTIEKQQEAVARMKESPCQCLEYHPKFGTTIYNNLMSEYNEWRKIKPSKTSVDKTWILIHLLSSQNCPYIRDERKGTNDK